MYKCEVIKRERSSYLLESDWMGWHAVVFDNVTEVSQFPTPYYVERSECIDCAEQWIASNA